MLQIEEYLQIMTRTIYFLPKDKEGTNKSVIWNHHNPYPNNLGRATRTPAIATNLHEHGKWKGQREIEDVVPPYEDIDGAARVWSVTPSKGKEREKGEGKTEVRGSRGWTEEEEAKEGGARRRTAVASGGAVVAPPCVGTERDRWGERRKPGEESGMREWEAGARYIFSGWAPDEKLQKLARATATTKRWALR